VGGIPERRLLGVQTLACALRTANSEAPMKHIGEEDNYRISVAMLVHGALIGILTCYIAMGVWPEKSAFDWIPLGS
jgi:hypothetical protein